MDMWSTKQRRSYKNTCSKITAGILLFLSVMTLTACQTTTKKEETKQTKEDGHWKPQEITKEEKAEAKQEVSEISKLCQNIKINKNKVTNKELEQIYEILTKKGYPTAKIGKESHSTKNAPVRFKPSKTSHADKLKTFYKETKAGKTTAVTLLQQNSSGGFARIKLESSKGKTMGILTTIYREENGTLSISEMVKYKVKKLELDDQDVLTLEFYLSDQAELQTDGTMQFQL